MTIALESDPRGLLDADADPRVADAARLHHHADDYNVSRSVGVCVDSLSLVEFDAHLMLNVTSADGFYDGFAPRPNATVRATMRRDGLPPPSSSSAVIADLGQGLLVSFRDQTNRANLAGEWDCDELFFAGRYEGYGG